MPEHQQSCPHEETIASLGNTLRALARKLDENTGKTDKILDLLQGEDPLSRPGEGLVAEVRELRREQAAREETIKKAKTMAVTGATSALGALGLFVWDLVKQHWK